MQIGLLKTVSCLKSQGSSRSPLIPRCPPYVPGAHYSLTVCLRFHSFTIGLPLHSNPVWKPLVGGFICSGIGLEIIVLPQSKQLFLTPVFNSHSGLYCKEVESMDWCQPTQCWLLVNEENNIETEASVPMIGTSSVPGVCPPPSSASSLSCPLLTWKKGGRKKVRLLSHVQLFTIPWTVAYSLLHSWDFPGENTGVGCHFLLQRIFLTQGLKLGLPHCRQMLQFPWKSKLK